MRGLCSAIKPHWRIWNEGRLLPISLIVRCLSRRPHRPTSTRAIRTHPNAPFSTRFDVLAKLSHLTPLRSDRYPETIEFVFLTDWLVTRLMKRLDCYLRTHRRQWGLSQRELSHLLGLKDRSLLSLLEKAQRAPTLHIALACETLFGVTAKELFPKFYGQVTDALMRRALVQHKRLEREDSSHAKTKRILLQDAQRRAAESTSEQTV